MIGEHGRALRVRIGARELHVEIVAVEDVVAEHERRRDRAPTKSRPITNACARPSGDGCTAYERLRPQRDAVAEQLREARRVLGRRDEQHVADAGEHQRRQRVVDHRLVVHRQQLLRHHLRDRVQPRARAAGEDDPLAVHHAGADEYCSSIQRRYSLLCTLASHAPLSRYQSTVFARPLANVSARLPAELARGSWRRRSRSGDRVPAGRRRTGSGA